jgi:thioredoxin reductase (NADPH)
MPRVVVLGSGPAGLTAALYLSRANLAPTVFEGVMQPGGQLTTTTEVDNFPGFPEGITGPELVERMKAQATRFGATFVMDEITQVDLSRRPFQLESSYSGAFEADALIIATGAEAKKLDVPGAETYWQRGATACATCDGFFFQDQDVAVIGGGDTAMEEATYLTRMCRSVTIIHRRDTFRASKVMQERALSNPKIKVIWNAVVDEVVGGDRLTGLKLRDLVTGATQELPVTGLFYAIGHTPNTAVFGDQLEKDDAGYLKPVPGSSYTKVPGVFVAGDVQDHVYRQAITAAGSGCMAAIDAERWLAEHA